MGNRFFRIERLTLLVGCAVVINSAFSAYLPQIGPSPLRFRPVTTFTANVAMFWQSPAKDSASPTNTTMADIAANSPMVGNMEPAGPAMPVETAGLDSTNSASTPAVILDGTVTVTPQMLVNFFKPVANGTNASPITYSTGSFTPPQSQPPPSSSATYKSN